MQRRYKLWSRAGMEMLRKLELEPWARQRRDALLEMLEQFDVRIEPLEEAVKQAAQAHPQAKRLQTHSGRLEFINFPRSPFLAPWAQNGDYAELAEPDPNEDCVRLERQSNS